MESWIPLLIVGGFILIVASVIRLARRNREIYRQIRMRLGFTRIENPDPTLLDRIRSVAQYHKERIHVSNLHKRDQGSCILYTCRIWANKSSNSGSESQVMVVPGLNLPAFKLCPTVGGSGLFGSAIKRLTEMTLKQGGFTPVDLSHINQFSDKKYVLVTKDPGRLAAETPESVWRDLTALPEKLFLRGEGDMLIFAEYNMTMRRQTGSLEERETNRLSRAIEIASKLADLFRDLHRSPISSAWR